MTEEFTAAAEAVLRRSPSGIEPLRELEWAPVLDLTDAYSAESFVALFRAQGRSLAMTPALGLLIAQRLRMADGPQDFSTIASYRAERVGDLVKATVATGAFEVERIVADISSDGLLVGSPSAFSTTGPQPLDAGCANVVADASDLEHVAVDGLAEHRAEAERIARLASAWEILGACEQLMSLAVSYVLDRRQFGTPIGALPPVQQLLAAAEVEVVGLRHACQVVMREEARSLAPDPMHDAMLVKALAGRVSVRVAQATLQVLGAIGFTWENDHHRYQRRALTLDALFGSYRQLSGMLGATSRSPLRRVGVL